MDGKLDAMSARMGNLEVRSAVSENRLDRLEDGSRGGEDWRTEVRHEISGIKTQNAKWAGAIAAIVLIANVLGPPLLRAFTN